MTGFREQKPTTFRELVQLYDEGQVQSYLQEHTWEEILDWVPSFTGPYWARIMLKCLPEKRVDLRKWEEPVLFGHILSECLSQYNNVQETAQALLGMASGLEKQAREQFRHQREIFIPLDNVYQVMLDNALPDLEEVNEFLLSVLLQAALLQSYSYEAWFLVNLTNSKLIPLAKIYGYKPVVQLLLDMVGIEDFVRLVRKYYRFKNFALLAVRQGADFWLTEIDALPKSESEKRSEATSVVL